MTTHQIELIDFRLIDESKMNPRKSFNEDSIKELSESISKQGLLQPITVRVFKEKQIEFPVSLKGKTCYEIVCGARRYKASVLAGMKVIPSIVREMTDEEAFDAMITENLQRKDVEPMDEARAFNELHKRGTSFEELAARFGKSVSFIRLRIKLNDLVPELAELLEKKELQISHAQELCKLPIEEQTIIFNEHYGPSAKNWDRWKDENILKIKRALSQSFKDLDKVNFDKTECINCKSRCGANVLFAEYESNSCQNPVCYKQKNIDYRIQLAKDKADSGAILFFSKDYKNDVTEKLTELGYELKQWSYNDYRKVEIEELPDREEYDEDDEDHQTEEEYQNLCKDAQQSIDKQNELVVNGELIPCWSINIYGHDDFYYIKNTGNLSEGAGSKPVDKSVDLIIKNQRNAQIKNEKTVEDLRRLMIESKGKYTEYNYPLTKTEEAAMYAMILKRCPHSFKQTVESEFKTEIEPIDNIKELIGTVQLNQIIRAFIWDNVTDGGVIYERGTQSVLKAICKEKFPDETTRIELKHEDTYLKRKENIDKQIKELTDANSEIR